MVTSCLPKSPCRRPLRASPAHSQTASFCLAHSSCPQRSMPTVLRSRQGKPLPLQPNPKVETPRREEGPLVRQPLLRSYWFIPMFFSVRFCFSFPNREVILLGLPPLCISSVDLLFSHLLDFVSLVSLSLCVVSPLPSSFFSRSG